MKTLYLFLIPLFIFAINPDPELLDYQNKYTLCKKQHNYQIVKCILNGNMNLSRLRGDLYRHKKVSNSKIKEALTYDDIYGYVLSLMPQTRRYTELQTYLDYLYEIESQYTPPKFKGDMPSDILAMKNIFNLVQGADLYETSEYTQEFKTEIIEFQRRHGLEEDAKIGPATKRALKSSIQSIIRKVKINLELERISPRKPDTYVLINIPEFMMYYVHDGAAILNMKVVVGKKKMRTPIFQRNMKYVVLNPKWNVPASIYKKEYAHKSDSYLKKKGFAYNSEGRLYQKSGRRNALGTVKFLFPNKFNVYMHDTPAKSLFKRSKRAFSHGCIRLEKPHKLLNALGYDYNTGKNKWLTLPKTIPVYVEYHTVWIDNEGVPQFREDLYDYERKLSH